jgi:hypothetical protein
MVLALQQENTQIHVTYTQMHITPRITSKKKKQQTPWPLVRERTIPTDRPPLVDEI